MYAGLRLLFDNENIASLNTLERQMYLRVSKMTAGAGGTEVVKPPLLKRKSTRHFGEDAGWHSDSGSGRRICWL